MLSFYIVIAHLKNGDKKFFKQGYNNNFGYVCDFPSSHPDSHFYDTWKNKVGEVYNSDIKRLELRKIQI